MPPRQRQTALKVKDLIRLALIGLSLAPLRTAAPAHAQDLVITAKSAAELLTDLSEFAAAAAPGDQGQQITAALKQMSAPGALQGLDQSKPVGLLASLPGAQGQIPMMAAAVPVTNLNQFLTTLGAFGLMVDANAGVPGFSHRVGTADGRTTLFVTQAGPYAYFSLFPSGAEQLRALKPADWAPQRPGAGDLSAVIHVDRIPEAFKQQVLANIEQQQAAMRQRRPDEDEMQYRARMWGMNLPQQAFTALLRDGRELMLDLILDPKTAELAVELSVSARPNTAMAKLLTQFSTRRSRFGGFDGGTTPLAIWASLPLDADLRKMVTDGLEQSRKEAEKAATTPGDKALADAVFDAITPTLTADSLDMGLAVLGPTDRPRRQPIYSMMLGMALVDGRKVESVFRESLKKLPPDDDRRVTLDFARAADGTAIHRGSNRKGSDSAVEVFGSSDAYLAINPRVAIGAVGAQGLETVKLGLTIADPQVVTATGRPKPPIGMVARLSRLVSFVGRDNLEAAQRAAAAAFPGPKAKQDEVRLTLEGAGAAMKLRMGIQWPALRFFSEMGQIQAQNRGLPDAKP